jgi:acid phosphatase type 7
MVEPATNFNPDNLYLRALHENGQEEFVLMGAGDISCAKYKEDGTLNSNWNGGLGTGQNCRQKYTADLMTAVSPDRVLTFGDVQYEQGEYLNFQESYALSWGQPALKSITSPTLGNHDYDDPNPSIFPQFACVRTDEQNECANGYFDFFNGVDDSPEAPAGQRDKGYYSYRLGGEWLILALNSELCGSPQTGTGCNDGTPQYEFVQQTLADNADAACTMAYWHHPRFSHGSDHGDQANLAQLYALLYQNNVDLVIVGHSHSYQRFAQLAPDGNSDTTVADGDPIGIRYIIVGTGGRNHTGVLTDTALTAAGRTLHPLQASSPPATDTGTTGTGAFGVIKLTLTSTGFSWDFESTTTAQYSGANEYTDASSDTCH